MEQRSILRAVLIGGLLGASAAEAARRLRPRKPPGTPVGLGAFESAPCYREVSERSRSDGP